MSVDHCSWTIAVDAAPPPVVPRDRVELNALYERTLAAPEDFVCLFSDSDLTIRSLQDIARAIQEEAFDFLQQRFVVLDEAAMRRTAEAVARLLARARTTPADLIAPFVQTFVDGRKYQPYDVSQVADALETSVVKHGSDTIDANDTLFLWAEFTYLKSLQRLLSDGSSSGRRVAFLRYNELYESLPRG
jgi:hypothetical protein